MRFSSVKSKLFFLVIIVIIPFTMLQYYQINREYEDKVDTELKNSEEFANAISTAFINYVDELWVQENIIGTYFAMNENLTEEDMNIYLKEVMKREENILGMNWIDDKGNVLASTNEKLIGRNFSEFYMVKRILGGEEKVLANLQKSLVKDSVYLGIGREIKKDGKLIGIITQSIDVDKLFIKLPKTKSTVENRFTIVDKEGLIVYKSDDKDMPFEKRKTHESSRTLKALQGEVVKMPKSDTGPEGKPRMGVFVPIEKLGWCCIVTSSYESTMAQYRQNSINQIIILAVVAIFSLLFAFLLGNIILKPVKKLKEAANSILKGDFTSRANVKGNDEIAATAQAFDHMAEWIEQNDKMKTQFFVNLSHELKTPLNVIFAAIQLISSYENNCDDKEFRVMVKKNLKPIKQNCYRLMRLLGNLIDITKCDSGFLKLKMGNYNIISIVEDITTSVVKYAESKKIRLIFDTEVEEKIIACDPDMIERIILNIISNSLKFTDENGLITVNIFDKGDKILISIKDTGIGIPEDKLKEIFLCFAQVDSSLNRNQEGSGIGLSLVKFLVEAQNGTIVAKSEVSKGTEMIIEFPVATIEEEGNKISENRRNCANSIIEKINIEFSDIYSVNCKD